MFSEFAEIAFVAARLGQFQQLLKTRAISILNFTSPHAISNGNRTEWSPIRSLIIRVITKSDDRAAGVRFVITNMITDRIGRHEVLLTINHKNYNFREKKNSQVM